MSIQKFYTIKRIFKLTFNLYLYLQKTKISFLRLVLAKHIVRLKIFFFFFFCWIEQTTNKQKKLGILNNKHYLITWIKWKDFYNYTKRKSAMCLKEIFELSIKISWFKICLKKILNQIKATWSFFLNNNYSPLSTWNDYLDLIPN